MSKMAKDKYENTILYLCDAVGGSLRGKKKLAKLLYYVDFDRYEYNESEKSVTGDVYKAWKMGPVPQHFSKVIDDDDLRIMQHVINKYGKLTGKQLEDLTHAEAPYIGTQLNDEIVYELAFYRGTDFSDVVAAAR